ncbi:probable caffeoyl-CoA O-methyltransferase 2 isoform X2 [Salvia splendens]|uniref:probable caffeoyl-CoA O-methyltransferase 2 isoform X2 n=1 Tax=Salvia splendens TaxID=180675 RepID=UPI001C25EC4F|nr:probable caffeoyl-CoA O-methyltransferase 2 isoform X2 [Salvia splendens]
MSSGLGFVHQCSNPLIALRSPRHSIPIPARGLIVSRGVACRLKALKSVPNSDTVVVADESYGRKEVISVNPRLYDYLLANTREPKILRELREETATRHGSQMQGYSSLAVALVLPEGGQLVACERDAKSLEVAQRYYDRAGVSEKVIVKHGLAADTLKSLVQNGEASSYDFAFVDAEKKMYQDYFELLLQLVRVGGVIVMDNVLWHGRVADPLINDSKTISIRNFNRKLMEDDRVSISMVPIGDGMTICRKR